jgi:hypothetical protein
LLLLLLLWWWVPGWQWLVLRIHQAAQQVVLCRVLPLDLIAAAGPAAAAAAAVVAAAVCGRLRFRIPAAARVGRRRRAAAFVAACQVCVCAPLVR